MVSFSTVPYAILPSLFQETNLDDDEDNTLDVHRSIYIIFENKRYELNNVFKVHPGAWCVGSSYNFLVFLDNNGCPLLLNPSSNTCINLPPFPDLLLQRASVPSHSYYVEHFRKCFVAKAALMCFPSPSQYTLAIMYGTYPSCNIAFCSNLKATWVEFDEKQCYCDIVFDNNILYTLSNDCSIEGWDFRQQVPRKILYVNYSIMEKDEEEETKFPSDKFSSQFYLVISKGEFFLIERFIADFVNADGEVVYEGYNLSYESDEVCPYRTKHFSV
jgi:WD40 repeat protein